MSVGAAGASKNFLCSSRLNDSGIMQVYELTSTGSVLTTMSIVQLFGNIIIPALVGKYPNRITWLYGLIGLGMIGALVLFIDASWYFVYCL